MEEKETRQTHGVKKIVLAAVIAVAAAVALASVAVAFMLRRAEVQSDFTPAVVTCAVHE